MLKPEDMSLRGKVALVTGAGRGIGYAIAESLANFGATVLLLDRDATLLEAAHERIAAAGGKAEAHLVDVTVSDEVAALADDLVARGQGLDILVNNVGDHLNLIKPFLETSEQEWDAIYEINLKHIFRCIRVFAPIMRDAGNGGSIINISSIEGYRAIPTCATYGAMKTAISGFVRSLAIELAPYRIRVNAVAPETTETEQVNPRAFTHPEHLHHWDIWNPLGRWGQPRDTAAAVLYLASGMADWVTGTTVHVDGGALAAAGWYRMPGKQQRWTLAPVIQDSGFIY
ncbi:SDR family oxidoreductase [Halieaceae bacterium]|nr:SDR family oxidoreductase [Halieaceae bacterium]